MKRQGLKSLVTGVAFVLLLSAVKVHAAESNIVEAAKKEGKLVAYVSMLTENATSLLAEFRKRFTKDDRRLSPPSGESEDDVAVRRDQQAIHGNILEEAVNAVPIRVTLLQRLTIRI